MDFGKVGLRGPDLSKYKKFHLIGFDSRPRHLTHVRYRNGINANSSSYELSFHRAKRSINTSEAGERPMDLRKLRYFAAIAETHNFRRASARLHIAQPALTRQIGDLEASLGIRLFERLPRGVRLTPFGETFLPKAKRILNDIDNLHELAQKASGKLNRVLKVGVEDSVMQNPVITKSLCMLKHECNVSLSIIPLSEKEQLSWLLDGSIDAGFAYDICSEFSGNSDFGRFVVQTDRILLALPKAHRLSSKASVTLSDLQGEPFVMIARDKAPTVGYDYLLGACRAGGLIINVTQEVLSMETLFAFVANSVGCSLVAEHAREYIPNDVILRPISDLKVDLELTLLWNLALTSDVANTFAQIVKKQCIRLAPLALAS